MPTTQRESSQPRGETQRNNRLYDPSAGNTVLSSPTCPGVPHAGLTLLDLTRTPHASGIYVASHPEREKRYLNQCRSPTGVGMRISTSAQKMVNQICSIEPCLNATQFAVCGAEVVLTRGVYSRSLCHHPRYLVQGVHSERVGAGWFRSTPRNLRPNLMALVCLVSDSFSNDEGWSCMVVVARSEVPRSVIKQEVK